MDTKHIIQREMRWNNLSEAMFKVDNSFYVVFGRLRQRDLSSMVLQSIHEKLLNTSNVILAYQQSNSMHFFAMLRGELLDKVLR